ncbi:hypothetical protein SeMB42_g06340, partial [Synchytrium endobioticum]
MPSKPADLSASEYATATPSPTIPSYKSAESQSLPQSHIRSPPRKVMDEPGKPMFPELPGTVPSNERLTIMKKAVTLQELIRASRDARVNPAAEPPDALLARLKVHPPPPKKTAHRSYVFEQGAVRYDPKPLHRVIGVSTDEDDEGSHAVGAKGSGESGSFKEKLFHYLVDEQISNPTSGSDDTAELLLQNMEVNFLPDGRIKSRPGADDDERAIVQVP